MRDGLLRGILSDSFPKQSNHSETKIRRIINYWLPQPPELNKENLEEYKHMIFDGTFLHRPVSIVSLMDAKTNSIINGKYDVRINEKSN